MPDDAGLLATAREAALAAHAPYSRFRVGAAVRAGGAVFSGCNIENASYGLTICAERVAIFAAISAGHRRIDALALACIDATDGGDAEGKMPCGACRQVLAEFADPAAPVHVDGADTLALRDLLPHAFRLA
jgi:cytidine deaminase